MVGISKYLLISVMNEKRDINAGSHSMEISQTRRSEQTRSEASKNKVITKRVSNISTH